MVEGWSPLAKGEVVKNKILQKISSYRGLSPAQIAIKWSLQKGIVTIPKSTKIERLEQNFNVWNFDLDDEEMKQISSLNCNMRVSWDPNRIL